jgi:hypothetical protein
MVLDSFSKVARDLAKNNFFKNSFIFYKILLHLELLHGLMVMEKKFNYNSKIKFKICLNE